jgi:hypothetical protein
MCVLHRGSMYIMAMDVIAWFFAKIMISFRCGCWRLHHGHV